MRGSFPGRPGLVALMLAAVAGGATGPEGDPVEEADLAVALGTRAGPMVAGRVHVYELAVTNGGPGRATGVTLQHELPDGGVFLGVEPASTACHLHSAVLVECDLGALEPGAAIDLRIGVLIDHRRDGRASSEAVVAASEPDPDGANDQAEAATELVAARAMVATHRGGEPALVMTLKEGETSVGIVFAHPAGGAEREHSVEAPGCRAVSLAVAPSFGGGPAPEIAILAAGFGGETRVLLLDSASRELLGDHEVAGDWLAMEVVALESFAGTAAPELALLLRARDGGELRVRVIDAASGRAVGDHRVAPSAAATGAAGAVPVPIGMVAVPSFDGTPSPELAILTRSPVTGEVRVVAVDAGSGARVGDVSLDSGHFPLGIVAAEVPNPGGATPVAPVAVLVLGDGGLDARVLDVASGAAVGSVDFGDAVWPAAFAALPHFGGGPASELALFGREEAGTLRVTLKDAATGVAIGSIAVGGPLPAPVPLGLAALESFAGGPAPELALLFESAAQPTRVAIFDAQGGEPLFTFSLP